MSEVYERLRTHLDAQPGGYPSTETLTLERKPQEAQPEIPKNQMEAHMMRINARTQARAQLGDKLERHKSI